MFLNWPPSRRGIRLGKRGCSRDDTAMGQPRVHGAMMVLPWALLEVSDTPIVWRFLGCFPCTPLDFSSRSKTLCHHLYPSFADGQRYLVGTFAFGEASTQAPHHAVAQRMGAVRPAPRRGRSIPGVPVNTSEPWSKRTPPTKSTNEE